MSDIVLTKQQLASDPDSPLSLWGIQVTVGQVIAMQERRSYCDMWEYKYGERWDAEDNLLKAAILETTRGKV